jgi:lysine decarboxylase
MADARRLVLITTPSDDIKWYDKLLDALGNLPERPPRQLRRADESFWSGQPERRLSLREAVFADCESVSFENAEGRIAAEPIGLYPPGIALVMPGEAITRDMLACLLKQNELGGTLFGVRGGKVLAVTER